MKNLDKRVDNNVTVSEELFLYGLFDITNTLTISLKVFLEKEGRYLGIVKSYMSSIGIAFEKFNDYLEEEDFEVFKKILYLLKPLIVREFNRLRRKRISEGDCVILMMRKLLMIVEEQHDYSYKKELKTVLKIINKLYDNIRNKEKKDVMYSFSNQIKIFKNLGNIGKYSLDKIDLTQLVKEKSILEDNGLRVDLGVENNVIDLG